MSGKLQAHVNGVRERVWGDVAGVGGDLHLRRRRGGGCWRKDFVEGLRKLLGRLSGGGADCGVGGGGAGAGPQGECGVGRRCMSRCGVRRCRGDAGGGCRGGGRRAGREKDNGGVGAGFWGRRLETLTLGVIPPTGDAVLVSSVTRSRVPELRAVMILGAVVGKFPKVVEEDPILSDGQREFFNGRTADPIGVGSDRQLLEMRFFDYSALTRASELLVVSYPLADGRGRAVGRSRYVGRLVELLGEKQVMKRSFDATSRTSVERIGTVEDLLASVVGWVRGRIRGRRDRWREGGWFADGGSFTTGWRLRECRS